MTIWRAPLRGMAAVWFVLVCGMVLAGPSYGAGPSKIHGNHPADIANLTAMRADGSAPLELSVVLGLHNQAGLGKLLAAQQDPKSPEYHHWLSATEFNARFGPTPAQIDAVKTWLTDAGFAVARVDGRARTITVRGSVATVEAAFATEIVTDGSN